MKTMVKLAMFVKNDSGLGLPISKHLCETDIARNGKNCGPLRLRHGQVTLYFSVRYVILNKTPTVYIPNTETCLQRNHNGM
jgi:hypothetical protein